METIPYLEFPPAEINAFRILCDRYGHTADVFALEAVVPVRLADYTFKKRRITVLHRDTTIWRIYPAGADDTWLIDFERDLSNAVFSREKPELH
jgi:hypothetical protein